MSFTSHRSAESRNFDCVFDPNYILPGAKDAKQARNAAINRATPIQVQTRYAGMFEDGPKAKRLLQRKRAHAMSASPIGSETSILMNIAPGVQRLVAGADAHVKNVSLSPSECKSKARSQFYHKPDTNVTVVNVRLSESKTLMNKADRHIECKYFGEKAKRRRTQTRGTQTLYRESSAQTLAYLPDVSNDAEALEYIEVFRLPTILPGDGPPGLYEVEVLERARKRWAFNKALKINLRRQIEAARELAKELPHKMILEAFEWERWIEREEYIQECQMLRLEIVIRMFDKREREMHDASKTRLERVCQRIAAERAAGLHKNEVEFQRSMRRLEIVRQKLPRNWRKTTISSQLGDPSSEFYGPQMRYGVNPGRRSFKGNRKAFEARMDNLEKRAVNMNKLECPYAKLKQWSKPKERITEAEQNFCSDENLKKLYENLKSLREFSTKQKTQPKCLIKKIVEVQPAPLEELVPVTDTSFTWEDLLDFMPSKNVFYDDDDRRWSQELHRLRNIEEIADEASIRRTRNQTLKIEMHEEELESMLSYYEGTTIGWLMRFLSEEMSRLQEQRKLHFITMLAQKERWRREAIEAGLRQKENDMRNIYEKLYQDTFSANTESCQSYLDEILNVDARAYADEMATDHITTMARIIDEDIERWIKSFQLIQNPQNYSVLRHLLKDLIFPDTNKLRKAFEAQMVVEHVIECVLFPNVYKLLEPHDISFSVAEEMIDRLIDTDLYYFTPEQSSECEYCECMCNCNAAKNEAHAIMRKVIRYAVPGRRWCTEDERIGIESVNDLLDDVFKEAQKRGSILTGEAGIPLQKDRSHRNIRRPTITKDESTSKTTSSDSTLQEVKTQIFHSNYSFKCEKSRLITGDLKINEKLQFIDPDSLPPDDSIINHHNYDDGLPYTPYSRQLATIRTIPSTYDIISIKADFLNIPGNYVDDDDDDDGSPSDKSSDTSTYSMLPQIFGKKMIIDDETVKFILQLIHNVVESFIPREPNDSQDSFFGTPSVSSHDSKLEIDHKSNTNSVIFNTILPIEPEGEEDNSSTGYELEIDELELKELRKEGCKCEQEIERLQLINRLEKEKKLKIIRHNDEKLSSFLEPSKFLEIKTDTVTDTKKTWSGRHSHITRNKMGSNRESQTAESTEVEPYMENLLELVMQERHAANVSRSHLPKQSLKPSTSRLLKSEKRIQTQSSTSIVSSGSGHTASISPSVQFQMPVALSNISNVTVETRRKQETVKYTTRNEETDRRPNESTRDNVPVKLKHSNVTIQENPAETQPVGILRSSNSDRISNKDNAASAAAQNTLNTRTPSVQFTRASESEL